MSGTGAARERRLVELEWADNDPHTFWDLARRQVTAAALRTATPEPGAVRRYAEVLDPAGVPVELRVRLDLDREEWATVILYRHEPRPFTSDDVAVAAAAAAGIARAVRTALRHDICDNPAIPAQTGSLLIDPDGALLVRSAAAEELLATLPDHQIPTVLPPSPAPSAPEGWHH